MEFHSEYDYIIVGGGPVGLTLAWLLASQMPCVTRILVIEREKTLGGCHRVRRENGVFTEHGPRIYSDVYLNTRQILERMGLDWNELFVPYQFSSGSMSGDLLSKLSTMETLSLAFEYFKLVANPDHGKETTVLQFMQDNNFSAPSQDELNRLCRLTDGAGADRYTLFELLNGFDQHVFYSFFLPSRPNDLALFKLWKQKLEQTGKVEFLLSTEVTQILISSVGSGSSSDSVDGSTAGISKKFHKFFRGVTAKTHDPLGSRNTKVFEIPGKQVILGIPPQNALPLLLPIDPCLAPTLVPFTEESAYDAYLPITFHWDQKLRLPRVWGFPSTEWGVISMMLSDYTKFEHPWSKTMISTCITLTDRTSNTTGKTADGTTSREELIEEVFRQINEVYNGKLPRPTISLLSSGVYRDQESQKWQTEDSAFVLTPAGFLPDQSSKTVGGLHWVGTHNGKSFYNFTALESAVTNALAFFLENCKTESESGYKMIRPLSLSRVIRYALLFIVLVSILVFIQRGFSD